jgi:assimilatory nitrate reductase catalytic subunit
MGGREVGGLANQLAAHMAFGVDDVARVESFWGAPDIAREPGLKAVDMFRAVEAGDIRFLWIMATNPAVSMPDTTQVRRALKNCEYVVLSDCVDDTDTAAYADVLLPAMGWGEKNGTVTNSERCISRQRALVPAVGQARPDWWIVTQVARRLGFGEAFDYQHPAQIFNEHAQLSGFDNAGSRDFDISGLAGLGEAEYEQLEPTYWPCPSVKSAVEPIVDGKFYTDSGLANFIAVNPALPAFGEDNERLLTLNSGRLRDQWHTMTRTGRVPKLMRHRDFFSVSLSPEDAVSHGVAEGGLVEMRACSASVVALVHIEDGLSQGQVFSPIHWSDQHSGKACINGLIPAVTDPVSGQPQLKYSRVSLSPVPVAGWGLLLTRSLPVLPPLAYWSRVTVAGGYLTLFAVAASARLQDVRRIMVDHLQSVAMRNICYQDDGRRDFRDVGLAQGQLVYASYLNAERQRLPDRDWLPAQLADERIENTVPLMAGFHPDVPASGRLICTCWEVGERAIELAVTRGARSVDCLGQQLRCGTQCGSCIPELKRMLLATAS